MSGIVTRENIADILSPYSNPASVLQTHEEVANDDARVKVSKAKREKAFAELNVLLGKMREMTFVPKADSKDE